MVSSLHFSGKFFGHFDFGHLFLSNFKSYKKLSRKFWNNENDRNTIFMIFRIKIKLCNKHYYVIMLCVYILLIKIRIIIFPNWEKSLGFVRIFGLWCADQIYNYVVLSKYHKARNKNILGIFGEKSLVKNPNDFSQFWNLNFCKKVYGNKCFIIFLIGRA